MGLENIFTVFTTVFGLTANGIAAILFWRIKRMDQDIESLKSEMAQVKMNYLNRFQDVKDHITELHLLLLEKISILDKSIATHFAKEHKKER